MGFSKAINPFTGRAVLCCDFCDGFKGHNREWVKKVSCPYGYCQDWAVCDKCFKQKKHLKKASCGFGHEELDKNHNGCKKWRDEHSKADG